MFNKVSFVGTQALSDDLGAEGAGVVVSQVMPSPRSGAKPVASEFVEAVKVADGDAKANLAVWKAIWRLKSLLKA